MTVSDESIRRLRERYAEASVREATLTAELKDLPGQIGDVRQALGNPFFYSGEKHGRPENAEKSIEKFTGYGSHEIARRLILDVKSAHAERVALREQLKAAGVDVD